jgi:sugar lactone lactonase YvrE
MAKVQCPKCGARTELSDEPGAERARCQYCQHSFDVTEIVPPVPVRVPIDGDGEPPRRGSLLFVGILLVAAAAGGVFLMVRERPPTPQPVPTPSEPTQAPTPAPTKSVVVDAAPPPLADVVLTFGGKGTGPGQMDRPDWITVGPDGTIWTVDLPSRIQAFDAKGTWLRSFQPTTTNQGDGPLEDDIEYIGGIAVDRNEHVWVSLGYDLLELSAKDGALIKKLPMSRPDRCFRHMAIDGAGLLYVTSNCAKQDVHGIFTIDTKTGSIVHRFAEPNNFEKATDWKMGLDAQGNVYCPHSEERKVVVLDRAWKLVRTFGASNDGFFSNIAIDGAGRIFVRTFEGIEVRDDQLRVLGVLKPTGREMDVAIGPEGEIYVLSSDGTITRMKWRMQ